MTSIIVKNVIRSFYSNRLPLRELGGNGYTFYLKTVIKDFNTSAFELALKMK